MTRRSLGAGPGERHLCGRRRPREVLGGGK